MDSAFNRTQGLQEVDDRGVWNECTFNKSQISLNKGGEKGHYVNQTKEYLQAAFSL